MQLLDIAVQSMMLVPSLIVAVRFPYPPPPPSAGNSICQFLTRCPPPPPAGNSIYQFLTRCLELLRKEFTELRAVSGDQLMYVKEDLIIPHHYTFYDFIVTKVTRR